MGIGIYVTQCPGQVLKSSAPMKSMNTRGEVAAEGAWRMGHQPGIGRFSGANDGIESIFDMSVTLPRKAMPPSSFHWREVVQSQITQRHDLCSDQSDRTLEFTCWVQ